MASCGVLLLWALPRLVALSLLSCPHPLPTIGQSTFVPGGIPLPERRHQPLGRASHYQRRQLTSILLQAWACSALPLDPMLPSIRWRRRRACWVPRRGRGRFRRRLRRRTGFIGIRVRHQIQGLQPLAPLSAASGNLWWLMPLGQGRVSDPRRQLAGLSGFSALFQGAPPLLRLAVAGPPTQPCDRTSKITPLAPWKGKSPRPIGLAITLTCARFVGG